MKYVASILTILVFASLLSAQSPSDRQINRQASDWMPADTIGLVRIADVSQFKRKWNESSFGAQMNDPAFRPFFGSLLKKVASLSDEVGIDLSRLWADVDGELSLGLTQNSEGLLSMIAVAELGNDVDVAKFLGGLETKIGDANSEAIQVTVGERELTSLSRNSGKLVGQLSYFRDGNQVVFSDGLETLAAASKRGTEGTDSLTTSNSYRTISKNTSADDNTSGLTWYANPRSIINAATTSMTGGATSPGVDKMIDRLGLDKFRGFGGTMWLQQGGMDSISSTYGYVETPLDGFWQAFSLPATRQVPPAWVKEDVSIYSQININGPRFFDALGDLVDNSQGAGTFAKFIRSAKVGNTEITVEDLVNQFDGPVHVAAEIPESATDILRQKAVFALEVSDQEKVNELVQLFAANSNAETNSNSSNTVYKFKLSMPEQTNLPPLELAVAVANGAIMFSPNADYLSQTISDDSKKRPLAQSPDYQEIAAQFPSATAVISYQRQDGRFEGLYEQLRSGSLGATGLPSVTGSLFEFDFSELPPFPAMSRYLQSTGSFIVPEENGFRIVTFATPPREQ